MGTRWDENTQDFVEDEGYPPDNQQPQAYAAPPAPLPVDDSDIGRRLDLIHVYRELIGFQLYPDAAVGSAQEQAQTEIHDFVRRKVSELLGYAAPAAAVELPFTPEQIETLRYVGSFNQEQMNCLYGVIESTRRAMHAPRQVTAPAPPSAPAVPAPRPPQLPQLPQVPRPAAPAGPARPQQQAPAPARPPAPGRTPPPAGQRPPTGVTSPRPTIRRPRKTRELITNEYGGQTVVERQEPAIMDDLEKLSPVMSVKQREFAYGQAAAAGEQMNQDAISNAPVYQGQPGQWKQVR